MNVETRIEPTMAGNVEYEVTDCDLCGHETALENVTMTVVFDSATHFDNGDWHDEIKLRGNFDESYRIFCPDCAELHLDYPGTNGFWKDIAEHLTGRRDVNSLVMLAIIIASFTLGVSVAFI